MKKKHDEGYALVFVLVVMVVLSLIAISLMTAALKNLRSQQATVAQMEAKYQAQGEMEKQIAGYLDKLGNPENLLDKGPYLDIDGAQGAKVNAERLLGLIDLNWIDGTDIRLELQAENEDTEHGTYRVECNVILRKVITGEGPYYISRPVIEFESYTVTYTAPSEPEEGGAQ